MRYRSDISRTLLTAVPGQTRTSKFLSRIHMHSYPQTVISDTDMAHFCLSIFVSVCHMAVLCM